MAETRLSGLRTTPQVHDAVARAAQRTGVGFDYLFNQAKIESSLDPLARARTSSAAGLFQFTEQTWLRTVKMHGADHGLSWAANAITISSDGKAFVPDPANRDMVLGLRFDADAAAAMAAELATENRSTLEAGLGRTAEPVDLYLAHFLGSEGALRFLKAHDADPSMAAASLFPDAAAANRTIFYTDNGSPRSLGDIRTQFAAKLGDVTPAQTIHYRAARADGDQLSSRPFAMAKFEEMPGRLSIGFAESAYQRLSALTGGAR